MENGNPVEPKNKRRPQKKKPYTKPAFRHERVFETQALSCGKVHPIQSACHSSRKSS